jgi:hypothetical protein
MKEKEELKCNVKGFAEKWKTHGEAFAWEALIFGEVGHSPPWHIVNDTKWRGPLEVKREDGINPSLCENTRKGRVGKLSRGRKSKTIPAKNERCGTCVEIIIEEKDKLLQNGS